MLKPPTSLISQIWLQRSQWSDVVWTILDHFGPKFGPNSPSRIRLKTDGSRRKTPSEPEGHVLSLIFPHLSFVDFCGKYESCFFVLFFGFVFLVILCPSWPFLPSDSFFFVSITGLKHESNIQNSLDGVIRTCKAAVKECNSAPFPEQLAILYASFCVRVSQATCCSSEMCFMLMCIKWQEQILWTLLGFVDFRYFRISLT